MKKYIKNGFTLVELLAVLVILAIIVLLAINRIKNSVKKSSEQALIANAQVFVKAVNDEASTSRLTNKFEDGRYKVNQVFDMGLNISGSKPEDGYVDINDGLVTDGCLVYSDGYISIRDSELNYVSTSCLFTYSIAYDYTGQGATFVAPTSGIYQLEVWGAQGGAANNSSGGYGGYSTGNIRLNKDEVLYVYVGQAGAKHSGAFGSVTFNGGGAAGKNSGTTAIGDGGGATHISRINKKLSELSSNKGVLSSTGDYYISDDIIIVAGGGGGADSWNEYSSAGGNAGGYKGVTGVANYWTPGDGATQIQAGQNRYAGAFGQGASGPNNPGGGAGGGGFFGGAAAYDNAGGGGGSGYIANPQLTDKHMACYECETSDSTETKTISVTCASDVATTDCAKQNNGYVKITFVDF